MVLEQTYLININHRQPNWFESEKQTELSRLELNPNENFFTNFDMITNGSTVDEYFSFEDSVHSLEMLFSQRSTRTTLADRNIIKADVAPILQAPFESIRKKKLSEHLEQKLEKRRSRDDLISVNIIKEEMKSPSNAFRIQPAQSQLKFHRAQIELSQKLVTRPAISQLITSNIIKLDVAPNLQATQRSLNFQRTSIAMVHKLEHRPSASDLVDHNILKLGIDIASNLHATQQQLKFNITAATLDHKLENRPNADVLLEHHIMMEGTPNGKLPELELLNHQLEQRPSKESLIGVGILQ